MEIHGYCDEKYSLVREAFEHNFKEENEFGVHDIGASVAATVEGEFIVDLWAGHQDAARTVPWQENTLVNVYSTTKTMTFLVALVLEDQGLLNLDAPVATYWPEFAQHGKESVCVKHVLSHSAGLPGFSRPLAMDELYDWTFATADLASQAQWWEAGTQCGYHGYTQGFLIGEIVRRVTGQSFGQFFKQEIADKVGADFHVGLGQAEIERTADLLSPLNPPPPPSLDPKSVAGRVYSNLLLEPETVNTQAWRRAEIPAANGHGNARSVVRTQTALANNGKAFGAELFSPKTITRARKTQIVGLDVVLGLNVEYAMGYAKPTDWNPLSPNLEALWWGGAGGSTLCVDPDAHICMSYVMNQMSNVLLGDPRGVALHDALHRCV